MTTLPFTVDNYRKAINKLMSLAPILDDDEPASMLSITVDPTDTDMAPELMQVWQRYDSEQCRSGKFCFAEYGYVHYRRGTHSVINTFTVTKVIGTFVPPAPSQATIEVFHGSEPVTF